MNKNESKVWAVGIIILGILIGLSPVMLYYRFSVVDTQTYTNDYMTVWKTNNLTVVNQTLTTETQTYNNTYNIFGVSQFKTLIDFHINATTYPVYNSSDSSTAIQWAIDHSKYYPNLLPDTYYITQPINITHGGNWFLNGVTFVGTPSNQTTLDIKEVP
jgi:hypothetical protein